MLGENRKNLILTTGLAAWSWVWPAGPKMLGHVGGGRRGPQQTPEPSEPGASSLATEGAGGGSQK